MKGFICLLTSLLLLFSLASCAAPQEEVLSMEPKTSQMKAICELAVMDCYYHNVAKFREENAQGILWWQKDKLFWIEYSGVVTLGIDASLVSVEVQGTEVSITMPRASVLNCTVDSASLTKDSFITAKNSAKIEVEDEVAAFASAQKYLEEAASQDTSLLSSAQQRAQALLEDYITNIGKAVGRDYSVTWIYLDGGSSSSQAKQGTGDTAAETAAAA